MRAHAKWNTTSQSAIMELADGFQAARRGEPKDEYQSGAWLDGYELYVRANCHPARPSIAERFWGVPPKQ